MDLPGLKESLEEMNLIGGMKMDKPRTGGIDGVPGSDDFQPDSDMVQDFIGHTIVLQNKFTGIIEENIKLKRENQKLQTEQQKIREILGAGHAIRG